MDEHAIRQLYEVMQEPDFLRLQGWSVNVSSQKDDHNYSSFIQAEQALKPADVALAPRYQPCSSVAPRGPAHPSINLNTVYPHSPVSNSFRCGRQMANAATPDPIANRQQSIAVMATDDEMIYLGTISLDKKRSNPVGQIVPAATRSVPSWGTQPTHTATSLSRSSSNRLLHQWVPSGATLSRSQARFMPELHRGAPIPTEAMNKLVKVGYSRGLAHNRPGQAVYAEFSRRSRFHHRVDLDINTSRNRISRGHVKYVSRLRGLTQCQIRAVVLDVLKRRFGPFLEEGEA